MANGAASLCSYNVGCTKRMGLFPNRKTSLENIKRQRALNAALKNCTVDPKKKVNAGRGGPTYPPPPKASLTPPPVASSPLQKPPAASATTPSTGHSPLPAQQAESSQCSDLSGYKRLPSPPPRGSPCPYGLVPGDPGQWDIQDVYQFISSLPGGLTERSRSLQISPFLFGQKH